MNRIDNRIIFLPEWNNELNRQQNTHSVAIFDSLFDYKNDLFLISNAVLYEVFHGPPIYRQNQLDLNITSNFLFKRF